MASHCPQLIVPNIHIQHRPAVLLQEEFLTAAVICNLLRCLLKERRQVRPGLFGRCISCLAARGTPLLVGETCRPTYLLIYLAIYLAVCLSDCRSIDTCLSIYLSACRPVDLSNETSIYLSLSIYRLSIYHGISDGRQSWRTAVCHRPSIYRSIRVSVYLPICLPAWLAVIHTYIHTYRHTYIHTCIPYMPTYIHDLIHAYLLAYLLIYIVHTHTCTYIYMHMLIDFLPYLVTCFRCLKLLTVCSCPYYIYMLKFCTLHALMHMTM